MSLRCWAASRTSWRTWSRLDHTARTSRRGGVRERRVGDGALRAVLGAGRPRVDRRDRSRRRAARGVAEEAVALMQASGLEPVMRIEQGSPHRRVVEVASEVGASLIVITGCRSMPGTSICSIRTMSARGRFMCARHDTVERLFIPCSARGSTGSDAAATLPTTRSSASTSARWEPAADRRGEPLVSATNRTRDARAARRALRRHHRLRRLSHGALPRSRRQDLDAPPPPPVTRSVVVTRPPLGDGSIRAWVPPASRELIGDAGSVRGLTGRPPRRCLCRSP